MEKTINQFLSDVKKDKSLEADFKADPVTTLENHAGENPIQWDQWIYRIIVIALGVTILLIVGGVISMLLKGTDVSKNSTLVTLITSLGSAAIGALAGLLAPSPKQASSK